MEFGKFVLHIGKDPDLLGKIRKNGNIVLETREGREGLRVARQDRPDLIVCDLFLPDISGLDFSRLIRNDRTLRSIPLILVNVNGEDIDEILEISPLNAEDFLTVCYDTRLTETPWIIRRAEMDINHDLPAHNVFDRRLQLAELFDVISELISDLEPRFAPATDGETRISRGLTKLLKEQLDSLKILTGGQPQAT